VTSVRVGCAKASIALPSMAMRLEQISEWKSFRRLGNTTVTGTEYRETVTKWKGNPRHALRRCSGRRAGVLMSRFHIGVRANRRLPVEDAIAMNVTIGN
jgi:hypothetical protein